MEIEDFGNLCMGCMQDKGDYDVCPKCGYQKDGRRNPAALPYQAVLNNKFLVGRILGKPGGFGITYLAWDLVLHTAVAVKEYLPLDLATRDTNRLTVVPYLPDENVEEGYSYGLKQFLNEARILSKFSHPNVVRVREFFEQNKTAYLVMDYYEGVSLEEYLKRNGGMLSESATMAIMMPILEGLREVHAKGFLHRDIKPSNIYLTKGGVPILLDFGAARLTMHGQRSRPISVILTPGFAPFEQYLEKREFGPTLDIYGVGATLYYLLTGKVPPPAMLRINKDDLIPPMQLNTAISSELNQAVMRALSVEAEKRPQSIDELCALLFAGDPKRASEHGAATPANPAIPPPAPPPSATLQVRCPRCKARNPIPRGTKPRHVFCSKCGSRMATSSSGGQPLVVLTGVLVVAVLAISLWQPKKLTSPPSASEEPQTEVAESEAEAEAAAEIISATSMQAPVESPAQPIVETPTQQMPTYSPPPRPEPRGPALGDRRSPPQGRAGEGMPPYPPPQNAIDACKNKQTEDACELLTPDGQIEGLCRQIHDYFACIPDKPPL